MSNGDGDDGELTIHSSTENTLFVQLYWRMQEQIFFLSWRGECDEADKVFCVGCDDTDDLTVTMMMTLMKMKKRA